MSPSLIFIWFTPEGNISSLRSPAKLKPMGGVSGVTTAAREPSSPLRSFSGLILTIFPLLGERIGTPDGTLTPIALYSFPCRSIRSTSSALAQTSGGRIWQGTAGFISGVGSGVGAAGGMTIDEVSDVGVGGFRVSPEAVGTVGEEGAGFSVLPAPGAQDIATAAIVPPTARPTCFALLPILSRSPGRTSFSIFSVICLIN